MSEPVRDVVELERDHRFLMTLIAPVDQVSPNPMSPDRMRTLLAEIQRFARIHFGNEEGLMAAYGYLESVSHIAEHREMEDKIATFVAQAESESVDPSRVRAFLRDWMLRHTTFVDGPMLKHIARARYEESLDA